MKLDKTKRESIFFYSRGNVAYLTDYNRKCPSLPSTLERNDAQNGWQQFGLQKFYF